MIKIGDKLPAVNLREYLEVAGEGCSIGPNDLVRLRQLARRSMCLATVIARRLSRRRA